MVGQGVESEGDDKSKWKENTKDKIIRIRANFESGEIVWSQVKQLETGKVEKQLLKVINQEITKGYPDPKVQKKWYFCVILNVNGDRVQITYDD